MLEGPTIFKVDAGLSAGLGIPRLDFSYHGSIKEALPLPVSVVPWAVFEDWRQEVLTLRETVEALRLRIEALEQPWWTRLWIRVKEFLLGR